MTKGNCCPLEHPIPPEALSGSQEPPDSFADDPGHARFAELIDQGLVWDPDTTRQGRLDETEAIILESRGLTSQTGCNSEQCKNEDRNPEFWRAQTTHKASVAAKLREAGDSVRAAKLELCHSYYTVAQCNTCSAIRKFPNRCDLFYCPECQPGLSRHRKEQVEWWAASIKQPKHVVLTVQNTPDLTRAHLAQLQKWFTALRRRKFARNWTGGFYSIEVTNEGKGWHLHIHALIDAKWIDAPELAITWQNVTNGLGRIVKVKDCRKADYLAEVTKYAVKGSQLAYWDAADILTFVQAFEGKRTFGVFGELYGARTEFAEFIAGLKATGPKCDCGSCSITYYSEADWILRELRATGPAPSRPPPPFNPQLELLNVPTNWTP